MWYMYFILAIIICYIVLMTIMKLRFHFWSIQPVFHIYDLNHWFAPYKIIQPELPETNKYINLINITTTDVNKLKDTEKTRFCNFIKSYYLRSHSTEYIPEVKHIMEYFYASNHPSFISIYKSPNLLFENEQCISFDEYNSVSSARVLHVTLKGKTPFPTYYVDNLCVNPVMRKKGIAPKTIQTLYYSIRRLNKKIKVFLFKREGELTAIMPLCTYNTYGYDIKTLPRLKLPHASMKLIEITPRNLHLAAEFIYNRAKSMDCVILPEITNIMNLMKVENIILYAIIENDSLIALYIYRDAATSYQGQLALECIGSLSTCPYEAIFLAGFSISLRKCAKRFKASKLLIENTSANTIVNRYMETHHILPFLKSPTAFFLYNYVALTCNSEKCFFLY